ncbi:MAG: hypothetical protein L0Y72_09950 [Gemmataceae bacterium]|nr:hypothetical protein [Gemmataceae bacterium]
MHQHSCPTCGRTFKSIRHYPRVLVLAFERLPIPEAVDRFSEAAAEKWLARKRREGLEGKRAGDEGINRTPEIASACARPEVREYLERLARLDGQTVNPAQLKPPFKPSARFKWAHPIPETQLYLSLTEGKSAAESEGVAEVEVYCNGPNLESAGGPTLQALGSIGRLRYQGLLL